MSRMDITGYLIVQLEDQLSPLEAAREQIENAIGAKATNISMAISATTMTIVDNGNGCDDPNVMATPSQSLSRHDEKDIGSKGAGAKQAMARYGRVWDIHTVPRSAKGVGPYHHYKVEWDPEGPLPEQYEGPGRPVSEAPREIREGGTKIVVSGRQEGFPRLRLENLCRELERSYRPALSGGHNLSITISNPDTGFREKLSNSALDKSKFASPVELLHGAVHGRPFTVRYGVLKEQDDTLSGCHYIYFPRVVANEGKIDDQVLPAICYVDVTLGHQWKRLLGTNESSVRFKDELEDELAKLLSKWITQQKSESFNLKMRLLAGKAVASINDTVDFLNKSVAGQYGPKPPEKRTPFKFKPSEVGEEEEEEVYLNQVVSRRRRAAHGAGMFGRKVEDRSRRCLELKIAFDPNLKQRLYDVQILNKVVVASLNSSPEHQPAVAEAVARNHSEDLRILGVMAYADAVALSPSDHATLFLALRKQGYEIDETQPADIRKKVANFFIAHEAKQRAKRKTAAA